jgi:hypothetical protein
VVHDGRTAGKGQWVREKQEVEEEEGDGKEEKDKNEEQKEKVGIIRSKCCLQVTVHPEYSVTDHIDEGFPWVSTVLGQVLSWKPDSANREQSSSVSNM